MPREKTQIGQILLAHGVINTAQLEQVLAVQKDSGGRLGDIIIAEGFASYLSLYTALAEHYALLFVDLLVQPPETNVLYAPDAENYILYLAIPWRYDVDGKITVAVAELSKETKVWVSKNYGENVKLAITSPLDIRRVVEREFGVVLEEKSRLQLWHEKPAVSARVTVPRRARKYLYMASGFLFALGIFFPIQSMIYFVAFCALTYFLSMVAKTMIFVSGMQKEKQVDWQKNIAEMNEAGLPIYTILVPMYREAQSIPKMIAAMQKMDYPSEKMDIKLILETDDVETYEVAVAMKPSHNFEIIRVPVSALRTKPKACNYALRFARGEYVTVFDADDRPEPLQLKKAIFAFRNSPKDVACLQARLNYYNAGYNWLTRSFSLEYSLLFNYLLHGLQRLGIPLPLGGTSNHLSLAHLRELGEWDPFNVTEDADLGVRLAALGLKTEMLDSYTMEESTYTMQAWIRQRSRWIKGYMQTWLVHMRRPLVLYKTLGLRGFVGFQFFVGLASFSFLTAPLVWLLAFVFWLFPVKLMFPEWLLVLSAFNLLINFSTHWFMLFFCVRDNEKPDKKLVLAAVSYPFYLLLHSVASYKALHQLIVKPHFWEKTAHGLAPDGENS